MTKKDKKNEAEDQIQQGGQKSTSQTEPKMVTVPKAEYDALKEQLLDQKDKYVRLLAEFENARKRQDRERAEFMKYANEGLLLDFLHVVDDLERTVGVAKEKHQDYEGFLKGVEMVMKRVLDLLKNQGVELLDPVGKSFDPYAHEIITQEPHADYEPGQVIDVFQKGYKLGDRVIRTAKVKVAAEENGNSEKGNEKEK